MSLKIKKESIGNTNKKDMHVVLMLVFVILAMFFMQSTATAMKKSKDCLATATITEIVEAQGRNITLTSSPP